MNCITPTLTVHSLDSALALRLLVREKIWQIQDSVHADVFSASRKGALPEADCFQGFTAFQINNPGTVCHVCHIVPFLSVEAARKTHKDTDNFLVTAML
jgi:hypothetical protein